MDRITTIQVPMLMRVQDVAKILDVSERTVWLLIARRRLASVKVGRGTRIRPFALDQFLERQTRRAV